MHSIKLPEEKIAGLVLLSGATNLHNPVFHSAQLYYISQGERIALTAMVSTIVLDYDVGMGIHGASLIGIAIPLENVLRGSFRRV